MGQPAEVPRAHLSNFGVYASLLGLQEVVEPVLAAGDRQAGHEPLDNAMADFAEAYAALNERDHKSLVNAISSGRVTAQTGP